MKKINIGICGWGNVATGLYKSINANKDEIFKSSDLEINIEIIGARRDNPECNPKGIKIVRDIFEVTNSNVDVVIELIGGVDPAKNLILESIKKGKHVITANKAVIFHHGDEIFAEADRNDVKVLYESAVCAGTPIIKLIRQELASNKISKISGMLNGTSNFILSNMEEGFSFQDTLKTAQDKGYAEPDPSFDIDGKDAAHKIGILSALAYGTSLPPNDFHIEGISEIHKDDFTYAKDLGYAVKHFAIAELNANKVKIRVHPVLLEQNLYLANLKGVRNGIELETDLIGKIHIAGSGAGQESTASGIISDIIYLSKIYNANYINSTTRNTPLISISGSKFKYYFYIEADDCPGVMASITSALADNQISIESIIQKDEILENTVPIILITDLFSEEIHDNVCKKISLLKSVKKLRSIRIES